MYFHTPFLGVTITELVLSELLLYSIIGIAQMAVIMIIMFAKFCSNVSCCMLCLYTAYLPICLCLHRFKCLAILPWLVLFTGSYHY